MLCEVDRSYIEDGFNLYGLRHHFPNFQECLDIILDKTAAEECRDPKVAQSAFMLYGLIHARFIVTSRGLDAMLKKYRLAEFGRCPRMLCRDQPVVPVGIADVPKRAPVKLYCPRCCEVYSYTTGPHGEEPLDGAFFGTSFAHLFIMSFDRWMPEASREVYTPRIFGFKIHGSAKCMQRRLASSVAAGTGTPQVAAPSGSNGASSSSSTNPSHSLVHSQRRSNSQPPAAESSNAAAGASSSIIAGAVSAETSAGTATGGAGSKEDPTGKGGTGSSIGIADGGSIQAQAGIQPSIQQKAGGSSTQVSQSQSRGNGYTPMPVVNSSIPVGIGVSSSSAVPTQMTSASPAAAASGGSNILPNSGRRKGVVMLGAAPAPVTSSVPPVYQSTQSQPPGIMMTNSSSSLPASSGAVGSLTNSISQEQQSQLQQQVPLQHQAGGSISSSSGTKRKSKSSSIAATGSGSRAPNSKGVLSGTKSGPGGASSTMEPIAKRARVEMSAPPPAVLKSGEKAPITQQIAEKSSSDKPERPPVERPAAEGGGTQL